MPTLRPLHAAGLAALLAFLVFAPTLHDPLVWDDNPLTWRVAALDRDGGLGAVLGAEFQLERGRHTGYWRPLVMASLWLDAKLLPWIPVQYHLTNVLLHAACCAVVVLLLARLLRVSWPALALGGALFAVHPVHTEAVAFVSGRTDLFAALFVMLSAWTWCEHRRRARAWPIAASAGCLLLAVLAKELAIMLPAALIVLESLDARDDGPPRWHGWRAWLVAWGLVAATWLVLRVGVAGIGFGAPGGVGASPGHRLVALAQYLRLLVWPWPLNAYYTPESLAAPAASFALATLLLVLFGGAAYAGHGRVVLGALAWIALFLLPVLGFVPIAGAVLAERFLYLPSFGLVLVAAAVIGGLGGAVRRAVVPASIVLLAVLAAGSIAHARVFASADALGRELERHAPAKLAASRNELALKLQAAGRHAEALPFLEEAVRLQPREAVLRYNLGVSQLALGKLEAALDSFTRAAALDPAFAAAEEQRRAVHDLLRGRAP